LLPFSSYSLPPALFNLCLQARGRPGRSLKVVRCVPPRAARKEATVRPAHTLIAAAGLAAACVLASVARPQDGPFDGLQPNYWPHRTFGIPVVTEKIEELSTRPTHLQLYYAAGRGNFQKGPKLPLKGLRELNGGKKRFLFEAPRDGDYEFAVQFVYSDGSVAPEEGKLAPQVRAVIDTVPPRVQIAAVGNGVEWLATDDNLDPAGVKLECKWPTSANWTAINDPHFKAADSYAWKMPPGKVLEVRVKARDRAGNEGISPVVRVPGEPGATVALPKAGGPAWAGNPGAAALPQPHIDYANTLDFNVDYTVQRMGRSGVQAAHLFVIADKGDWRLVKRFPVKLMPDDKGPHSMSLPYRAEREGTYGFYVIPESGAGKRAGDPKKDDSPMVLVVVDTTKPFVRLTGVQVKPGGARGPLVEFTWNAADANLMPQPVSLEWSLDKNAERWNEVKYRLDNNLTATTGRFTWEVPDEKLWKFYARIRAVDKASNVGEHVWGQDREKNNPPTEIIVDLEKPSATIDRVRGGPPGSRPDPQPSEKPEVPKLPERPKQPELPDPEKDE
jgi:hypothetical protein